MESHLDAIHEKIFDWLETADWSDLTPAEQNEVLCVMTADQYVLQRRVITEASSLFTDEQPALILPQSTTKMALQQRSIPLYQAILAVAATVLVFLFIWPSESPNQTAVLPTNVQQIDSVFIRDTIVKYVTTTQEIERVVYDTLKIIAERVVSPPTTRMFDGKPSFEPIDITLENQKKKGNSLQDDNSIQLLPSIVNSIY